MGVSEYQLSDKFSPKYQLSAKNLVKYQLATTIRVYQLTLVGIREVAINIFDYKFLVLDGLPKTLAQLFFVR